MNSYFYKQGMSIVELILAMAILAMIAGSLISVSTGSFAGVLQGGDQSQASALAYEAIEGVLAVADKAWNEMVFSTSSVSASSGVWGLVGEDTVENIGRFKRTISFADVCRDATHEIVLCPGSYIDQNAKEVIVTVEWNPRAFVSSKISRRAYITNWGAKDWVQTDWSGGDGQGVWENGDEFASSTGVEVGTAGVVTLASGAMGSWENIGTKVAVDTTDTDFASGQHDQTDYIGVGEEGTLVLANVEGVHLEEGEFYSRVLSGSDSFTTWSEISWIESNIPDGTIEVMVRFGNTPNPDVSWSLLTPVVSGEVLDRVAHYVQYYVYLACVDCSATPRVEEMKITFDPPTNTSIQSVAAPIGGDMWLVTNGGELLHTDGEYWEVDTTITGPLYDLGFTTTESGLAVGGGGKILAYDVGSWSEVFDTGNHTWRALSTVSSSTVIVAGNGGSLVSVGTTSWSFLPNTGVNNDLYDIEVIAEDDIWVVGADGIIAHHDGLVGWDYTIYFSNGDIYGLDMLSSNEGWAVGAGGNIYFFNGSGWSKHTTVANIDLHAVRFIASDNGWAVGDGGALYHWDGLEWSDQSGITNSSLYGFGFVSPTELWSTGAGGTVLKLVSGGVYNLSGTLTSSAYDLGASTSVHTIEWDGVVPACDPDCAISAQLAVAPDAGDQPGEWSPWYGAGGTGDYYTNATGTLVTTELNGYRWLRYQFLLTGDGNETPTLESVRINYK